VSDATTHNIVDPQQQQQQQQQAFPRPAVAARGVVNECNSEGATSPAPDSPAPATNACDDDKRTTHRSKQTTCKKKGAKCKKKAASAQHATDTTVSN